MNTDKQDSAALVLVEKERGALRITALDAGAVRVGLRRGMALTEARVLIPTLETATADSIADAACLRACADACEMFTPLVAEQGQDGLLLDITGCAHLFDGEEGMLQRLRQRFAKWGLTSSGAIASTPHAAWAFAKYVRNTIVAAADTESVARTLPLAALEQEGTTTLALSRAGFRTLGDLANRPSNLLVARFGEQLSTMLRRLLGQEDLRITPLRSPPELLAERHFAEPMTAMDGLLQVLERLVADLVRRLNQRGEGGRLFEISVFRADGAVRRFTVETASGTRDTASVMRLARLKVDALADPLDPGFGFDALRLAVIRSEPLDDVQHDLVGADASSQHDPTIALVERLVARFGRENVRQFVVRDTHNPVRASSTVAFGFDKPSSPSSWPIPEADQAPARPLTLYAPPQPIDVLAEVPDSPPLRFRWRRVLHDVRLAEGPERIAPEWWRDASSAPETRDYYRVEDGEGHRFWIFRQGFYDDAQASPRWFLHGLFA